MIFQNVIGQESQFIQTIDSLYQHRHTEELCDLIKKELYEEKKYPDQESYLLEKLVNAYLLRGDFANAKIFWHKLNTITGEKITKDKARITFMKSGIHYFENNIDSAYITITEAKEMYVELKDTISIINCLGNIGTVHLSRMEYEEGLGFIKEAIGLSEAKKVVFFELYLNTALAYKNLKRKNSELEAHYNTLKAAKIEPIDFNNLVQSFYNIAEYQNRNGDFIQSQFFLDSCQFYFNNNTKPIFKTDYINLRISNFIQLGQVDSITQLFSKREKIVEEKLSNYYNAGIREIEEIHKKQTQLTLENQRIKNKEDSLIQQLLLLAFALSSILAFLSHKTLQSRKKKSQTKIERKQAELNLSLAQINPKFILGSISKIQNTLRDERNHPAADHLSKLSKLMRQTLENSRNPLHPLDKEIAYLKEYLSLKKLQLPFNLEFNQNLDSVLSEAQISPMVIQPFIERIFELNNEYAASDLFNLKIQLNNDDKFLFCNIESSLNGNPILFDKAEFLASEAIQSIIQKINSLIEYPEIDSGMKIVSTPEQAHSKITLSIPIKNIEI